MNGRAIIKFRGRSEEVRYIDHGYNEKTGVQRIDWHFTSPMRHNADLTQDEEEAIYDQSTSNFKKTGEKPLAFLSTPAIRRSISLRICFCDSALCSAPKPLNSTL